jgi:hypothetical protein
MAMTLALTPALPLARAREKRRPSPLMELPKRQRSYQLGWIFCDCVGGGAQWP